MWLSMAEFKPNTLEIPIQIYGPLDHERSYKYDVNWLKIKKNTDKYCKRRP